MALRGREDSPSPPALDRFEIRRFLGAGGFGDVYEAYDRRRDMVVALKALREVGPEAIYRFKREFRTLADVAHRNLVTLYELSRDGDVWFFTMQRVDGRDFLSHLGVGPSRLAERLMATTIVGPSIQGAPGGADPAPPEQPAGPEDGFGPGLPAEASDGLRELLVQLVHGLGALHGAGILHRDIKPPNVLVSRDGRLVLLDFGLVAELGQRGTADVVVGTPAYLAPEQIAGESSPASDWYGVGVMIYQALTGRLPFAGSPTQVMVHKQQSDPMTVRVLNPEAAPDLAELADALLARDPGARPTGDDVLAALTGRRPAARLADPGRREPPLVGRATELEAIDRAWSQSRHAPSAVLVEGASGIGKSALTSAALARLERRGARVLRGRCYPRESVPFKALDTVVDQMAQVLEAEPALAADVEPGDVRALARLFPVLAAFARPADAAPERSADAVRAAAARGLRGLWRRMASARPLVICVDDLQWTDPDSVGLLRMVMGATGRAPPLLLLATWRLEAHADVPGDAVAALGETVRRIRLGPLPAEDARALAARLLGTRDPERTGLLAEAGAGHPLFIQELARAPGARADDGLDAALRARVASLPERARSLVRAVAVAGGPIDPAVAAASAEVDRTDAEDWIEQLRVGNLVTLATGRRGDATVDAYHSRVREAVLAGLSGEELASGHAALARALLDAGDGSRRPERLVAHLVGAGQPMRAAQFAEEAARRADAALAFDRAAELYGQALALGDHPAGRARELRLARGHALINAGRGRAAADELFRVARDAGAGLARQCRRLASEQLLISGHVERGLAGLRALLDDIDQPLPARPSRAIVQLVRERVALALRGYQWEARSADDVDPAELERLELLRSAAFGLGMSDNLPGAIYQARATRAALDLGEPRLVGRNLAAESIFYGCLSTLARRRTAPIRREASRIAARYPEPLQIAWADGAEGILDVLGGALERGTRTLERVEELFRDHTTGTTWELNSVRMFRYLGLRFIGELVRLGEELEAAVGDAATRGDRLVQTTLRRASGPLLLAAGDASAAEAALDETVWVPLGQHVHLQHLFEHEARANIALWRGEAAAFLDASAGDVKRLRRGMVTHIQVLRCVHAWARARLFLARGARTGSRRDRARALARAGRLRIEGVGYARAWSSALGAGVAAASGDRERALAALDRTIRDARAAETRLLGVVARWHRARLRGDTGEGDRAAADMRRLGVARPARMAAMMMPGFADADG